MAEDESFITTVTEIWNTRVEGCPMYRVYHKLKLIKAAMKKLNRKHYSDISNRVIKAWR